MPVPKRVRQQTVGEKGRSGGALLTVQTVGGVNQVFCFRSLGNAHRHLIYSHGDYADLKLVVNSFVV